MIMLAGLLTLFAELNGIAGVASDDAVIEQVRQIVEEVKRDAYPELKNAEIAIKLFDSPSDYFQTRFTLTSFFFRRKLHCLLRVNRNLLAHQVPDDGLRAIIAHELGHALYFNSQNRISFPGLLRLGCKDFAADFERRTDLEAIARGYGDGLKTYRLWLYGRIPAKKIAEKKRNYFSPEEIDLLQLKLRAQPKLIQRWRTRPPRSLQEIVTVGVYFIPEVAMPLMNCFWPKKNSNTLGKVTKTTAAINNVYSTLNCS